MAAQTQTQDATALLTDISFDNIPDAARLSSFGVEYAHVRTSAGGNLYLTRYGWPIRDYLMPEQWYDGRRYRKVGEKLTGSTGSVYRMPIDVVPGRRIDVVVKFSRVGQEVPLVIATTFPEAVSSVDLANARFNSPFEEFGLVAEMREGRYGSPDVKLRAQRPLAIYVPPEEFDLWSLGRSESRFAPHQVRLERDQEGRVDDQAIELDIRRDYVLVYSWVKGQNAEDCFDQDLLRQDEFERLTPRVVAELTEKGFRVLDNKPKHFILRQHPDGRLLRRDGQLVYALVDFELLERTEEYRQRFRSTRRARYWYLQTHSDEATDKPLPPHAKPVRIFGVDYLFTAAPNGGKVWVVGHDPDLLDYFMPDRWRRTPRVKLSPINEVYRTRTRDNIHVVYRRSRAGEKPHVDPFYEQGRRIREYGYNSPFEEIAIALELRQAGLATVHPRAVYRTGHQSVRAEYISDRGRYLSHGALLTPEEPPEPVLSPFYDYYTLWGLWRGIDPMKNYRLSGYWGFIDADFAYEQEMLTKPEYEEVVRGTRQRLARVAPRAAATESHQFLLSFDPEGRELARDNRGRYQITLGMDALNAFDMGLLDERQYRGVIEHVRQRIREAGFEALNLGGHHLLLTMDPDGVIRPGSDRQPEATLCNFDLICRV